jgi:RNA polymerase sigma factor (sigma-70 family)
MAEAPPPRWELVIAQHDRRVLLMLLAMGLRVDEAKELAQATWLRLIEQEARGALGRLDFPGLALKQARFLALDELRRRGRTQPLDDQVLALPAPTPSPEAALIDRQSLDRVREALTRVSPSAQRVFRAVYESPGAPHQEVAERLGLSVQRVRQVVCEVRKVLRAALESEGTDHV